MIGADRCIVETAKPGLQRNTLVKNDSSARLLAEPTQRRRGGGPAQGQRATWGGGVAWRAAAAPRRMRRCRSKWAWRAPKSAGRSVESSSMRLLRALMVGAKVHSVLPVTPPAPTATTLAGYIPLPPVSRLLCLSTNAVQRSSCTSRSRDGLNAEPRTCGVELELYCNTCEFQSPTL